MKVSELMQELMKHNEPGAEIRLAWYSNGNYNVTDDFELTIYKDSYEDEKGDIITSRDIVLDLGDLNL